MVINGNVFSSGDSMDNVQNKPKNSRARIEANNRYAKKTDKNISIKVKPNEAEFIRDTARKHNLSIAQLILQSVRAFDNNSDTFINTEDINNKLSS